MPSAVARRWIIAYALAWGSACRASGRPLSRPIVRNSGPLGSSARPDKAMRRAGFERYRLNQMSISTMMTRSITCCIRLLGSDNTPKHTDNTVFRLAHPASEPHGNRLFGRLTNGLDCFARTSCWPRKDRIDPKLPAPLGSISLFVPRDGAAKALSRDSRSST